jgi:threonine synthase
MPDISAMKEDMFSVGISNPLHYETMKDVYMSFGIILDPHGAVGWKSLEIYLNGHHDQPSVIYETADPGKFPEDVEKAIGIIPELPPGMKRQTRLDERIYALESESEHTVLGFQLSKGQVEEAKAKIRDIWKDRD